MRLLPDVESRVETGAVQFGQDDWPGVFFRGDDAVFYAMALRNLLSGKSDAIDRQAVSGLLDRLLCAMLRPAPPTPSVPAHTFAPKKVSTMHTVSASEATEAIDALTPGGSLTHAHRQTLHLFVSQFAGVSESALYSIVRERAAQDAQWGGPAHDDAHCPQDFMGHIQRQIAKAEAGRMEDVRERMVKIAALAVASIEAMDRKADL